MIRRGSDLADEEAGGLAEAGRKACGTVPSESSGTRRFMSVSCPPPPGPGVQRRPGPGAVDLPLSASLENISLANVSYAARAPRAILFRVSYNIAHTLADL